MVAQLGPYLIDETLAEGGMARVFRARLRGLGGFEKTLVLKQIRPELAKDPRFVEMFVREANTLVQMSHPHIVPVYELGAVDGSYYLSMEYIDGATLARLLQDGPLGPALVAQLGVQLCDALDYAHGRFGILHRDITPRNLIVDDAGHMRLLDFGIAAAFDVGGAERFGSPGYMSPEQVRGQLLKPTSDLFSLGAVLFEALTGKPAFEKVVQGSLGRAPQLSEAPGVPVPLANLINGLLAQDPAQRPQSALEVGRTLRGWLSHAQPEGAFAELQQRARRARQKAEAEQTSLAHATRRVPDDLATQPLSDTAVPQARAFATSPVLTEMLRSATGLAQPTPTPPQAVPVRAVEDGDDGPVTRRIEADEAAEPAAHPKATAFMLRWWPMLAVLAFGVAGVVMLGAPREAGDGSAPTRSIERPSDRPPSPPATPVVPAPPAPQDAGPDSAVVTEPAPTPATEARVDTAWLTLNAVPWAAVSLDGHRLGTTPLRRIKTHAGAHVLQFDCPPLGKTRRLSLSLKADADARVMVDLSREPARTVLDGASELR